MRRIVVNACTTTLSLLMLINWWIDGWSAPEPMGLLFTLPLLLLQLLAGLLPALLVVRRAPGGYRRVLLTLAILGPTITAGVSVACALGEGPW